MSDRRLHIFQRGWNFEQDGPGNRLVYHLAGCNLSCPWCANPEGMDVAVLITDHKKLTPSVCPHGAIRGTLDRSVCDDCMAKECVTQNRNEGIRMSSSEHTIDALLNEVLSAQSLFHSGGGVTLSGGEPTMQFDGARAFLEAFHAEGVDTAVETNGTHARLPELLPFIDTLIIDMKHHDDASASAITGSSMQHVRANIRAAVEKDVALIIRITLIPGFNSTIDDMHCFAEFFASLPKKIFMIELLAFHEYGAVKWTQCGKEYRFHPSAAAVTRTQAASVFRERGLAIATTKEHP